MIWDKKNLIIKIDTIFESKQIFQESLELSLSKDIPVSTHKILS